MLLETKSASRKQAEMGWPLTLKSYVLDKSASIWNKVWSFIPNYPFKNNRFSFFPIISIKTKNSVTTLRFFPFLDFFTLVFHITPTQFRIHHVRTHLPHYPTAEKEKSVWQTVWEKIWWNPMDRLFFHFVIALYYKYIGGFRKKKTWSKILIYKN